MAPRRTLRVATLESILSLFLFICVHLRHLRINLPFPSGRLEQAAAEGLADLGGAVAALDHEAGDALLLAEGAEALRDVLILKSFIEKGELGKVFYTKAGWLRKLSNDNPWITRKDKSGGGVFLDLGIVMLDLNLWMLDFPPVERVSACSSHLRKM